MAGPSTLTNFRGPPAAEARPDPPNFVIKYEPLNLGPQPLATEDARGESLVYGTEDDAVRMVQQLVEEGRTTPGRVRVYAHAQAIIQTSVSFPPSPVRPASR